MYDLGITFIGHQNGEEYSNRFLESTRLVSAEDLTSFVSFLLPTDTSACAKASADRQILQIAEICIKVHLKAYSRK